MGKRTNITITEAEKYFLVSMVKASDCTGLKEYKEMIGFGGDNESLCCVEDLKRVTGMSDQQIGGFLSSLEKKLIIELFDADEWSLGCNCWNIYDDELWRIEIE